SISSRISCILTLFFAIFPLPYFSIHHQPGIGNFYAFILREDREIPLSVSAVFSALRVFLFSYRLVFGIIR
ncbi:MAG: hypothetical protein LBR96_04785, partial [Treponema sp.]|nr:hypothetical protein [Treponema sp.]